MPSHDHAAHEYMQHSIKDCRSLPPDFMGRRINDKIINKGVLRRRRSVLVILALILNKEHTLVMKKVVPGVLIAKFL
jgi:hypothetical protein